MSTSVVAAEASTTTGQACTRPLSDLIAHTAVRSSPLSSSPPNAALLHHHHHFRSSFSCSITRSQAHEEETEARKWRGVFILEKFESLRKVFGSLKSFCLLQAPSPDLATISFFFFKIVHLIWYCSNFWDCCSWIKLLSLFWINNCFIHYSEIVFASSVFTILSSTTIVITVVAERPYEQEGREMG